MAESTEPSVETPTFLSFDNWRQAINANVTSRDEYKKLRVALKLPEAGKHIGEVFDSVVAEHLSGLAQDAPMAVDIRDALEFGRDICPDPWRAAFITWVRESDEFKAIVARAKAKPKAFTYHKFIGEMCESFGQALSAKGEHAVVSPYYQHASPDTVQYKTRLSDGSWKDIRQDELLALARDPKGPQIVYSANHAFLDNQQSDLDGLQDQFSKLFDGSRLPSQPGQPTKDSGHLSTYDAPSLKPSDTITVFATHTRENRFLNLAQLFNRLDEVDRHHDKPQADKFEHVAPIAATTVETLLKSVVVDADVAKIHFGRDAAGKPKFFDESITLRDDAVDIIRRQRYRGFSKGGNDFRDAMRLLVHSLDSNGKAKVTVPEGFTTNDLISNISMIVFGLNEKPMADYYREHGVRVPMVSSKNDITAPVPPFLHDAAEPVYNYTGSAKDDGHSPQYSVNGMLADWRIHDLLRMHGAISQGQAAITDVNFLVNGDGSYHPNVLTLEVAQGTSDSMMQEVVGPLNQALRKAGLKDTTLKCEAGTQGRNRYRLMNNDPEVKLVSPDNINKVQSVLRSLSSTHKEKTGAKAASRPEMPLWVSEATAYEKISGMSRYLTLQQEGKLDQKTPYPVTVIDPASVTARMNYANTAEVRPHPRTQRNLNAHPRIAGPSSDKQQIG